MTLTQEKLKELLHYDPETGLFTWKNTRHNAVKIGAIAGYWRKDGYVGIYVLGHHYLAHRIAWLYMTCEWPEFEIDHENRKYSDNRWKNLREATHLQNMHNVSRSY